VQQLASFAAPVVEGNGKVDIVSWSHRIRLADLPAMVARIRRHAEWSLAVRPACDWHTLHLVGQHWLLVVECVSPVCWCCRLPACLFLSACLTLLPQALCLYSPMHVHCITHVSPQSFRSCSVQWPSREDKCRSRWVCLRAGLVLACLCAAPSPPPPASKVPTRLVQ
jgi:hypothetical protein